MPGRQLTLFCLVVMLAGGGCSTPEATTSSVAEETAEVIASGGTLQSIAIRVHRLNAMVAFYEEAFGAEFREVDTFGIASQFAEIDGLTIKLVPIRSSTDFEGFPSHQLGFEVEDIDAIIRLAERHGGRIESEIQVDEERRHGAVRDPDGNTIELYQYLSSD